MGYFREQLKNQGVALVTVLMTSLAVSAMVAAILQQVKKDSFRSRLFRHSFEVDKAISELGVFLSNKLHCDASFTRGSPVVINDGVTLTRLYSDTFSVTPSYQTGHDFSGVILQSMTIAGAQDVEDLGGGAKLRRFNLAIAFTKEGADEVKNIEMYAHVNTSNQVTDCFSKVSVLGFSQDICSRTGGYVASDGSCDPIASASPYSNMANKVTQVQNSIAADCTTFRSYCTHVCYLRKKYGPSIPSYCACTNPASPTPVNCTCTLACP